MKIKHIFFDLDHTLWDFDKNSKLTFKFLFEKHEVAVDFEAFMLGYEVINLKYWKLYRNEEITKEELRFQRLNEAFLHVNYKASTDLINVLAEAYITYLSTYNHLFDHTISVLDYLKPKYKLHIITNGFTEVQTKKMKNSGLLPYFETITDAEQVGVKKPNSKIFNFALNAANASINESVMIGDSYEADILGALNNNLDAVFFNPKKASNPKQVTEIKSLLELKELY